MPEPQETSRAKHTEGSSLSPRQAMIGELRHAARSAKPAAVADLMRRAADVLQNEYDRELDDTRHARAMAAANMRCAVGKAYETGRKDGFDAGVATALDPVEPDHAKTVRAYHEARS